MLDGPQFVRAVMVSVGVENAAGLADAMGWKRGTERLVAKWLAGSNRPSYKYMLQMVERAGWLSSDGRAQPQEAAVSLETLERRLQEASELTAENFDIVKEQLALVVRRLPGEDAPGRTAEVPQ